jgi:hypothetical protein
MTTVRKREAGYRVRLSKRLASGVLFAAGMLLLAAVPVLAQPVDIELPTDITTIDEFIAFRDATADTAEGGAAVMVLAMLLYVQDPELGHDAMVIALDSSELREDSNGYRGYTLGNRGREFTTRYLAPRPYLAYSYLLGTSPENGYTPPDTWTVRLTRNAHSEAIEGRVRLFVACTGADSPRPMTLRPNNRGVWKALEFSSLFVGIRPPVEVIDDPL